MKSILKSLAIVVFAASCALAHAQQVEATLSQDVAGVGQAVRLTVVVKGTTGAELPSQLDIDGLEARFAGKSVNFEMRNFNMSSSATYTYVVVPMREGDFTIPPLSVRVNGKMVKTAPLTLHVGAGGAAPAPPVAPAPGMVPGIPPQAATPNQPPPQAPPANDEQIVFGDLVLPRESAYVGEVIPLEMRFYLDARFPARIYEPRPTFSGDGFTVLRFSKPTERQQEINGRIYNVVSYKTAITPVKPGPLAIAPASLTAQMQLPSANRGGADDLLGGLFGNFGGFDLREVPIQTKGASLEIKPLPTEGRPEEFSGAVGQFSLQASASPKKAGPGDPISLNVTVSGRGNFDAMSAPELVNSENWQAYPPSEKFDSSSSDPIGYNGTKNFNFMIVARKDLTATPGVKFSYFDPALSRYVTLSSKPVNVEAKGIAVAAPVVAAASATPQASATPAAAAPVAQPGSALVTNFRPATFTSFIYSRPFLVANGAVAVLWLGVLAFCASRRMADSAFARRSASQRELKKMLHQLEDSSLSAPQFYDLAARFVQMRLGAGETLSDVRGAVDRAGISETAKAGLHAILEQHDESKYSSVGTRLGAEQRQTVIKQLKAFHEELR